MKLNYKYQGLVIDAMQCGGKIVHRTRYTATWEDAQRRAEKLCRRKYGNAARYQVAVI